VSLVDDPSYAKAASAATSATASALRCAMAYTEAVLAATHAGRPKSDADHLKAVWDAQHKVSLVLINRRWETGNALVMLYHAHEPLFLVGGKMVGPSELCFSILEDYIHQNAP
jgi:hypothetical protein